MILSDTSHPALSPYRLAVCDTVLTLKDLQAVTVAGDGKWLRVGEVADRLGVSVGTARNYIDAGKFRSRRLVGGARQAWAEDVELFAQAMEDQAEEDTAES